jgi:radical SAM PhpK family P-methyltransferase
MMDAMTAGLECVVLGYNDVDIDTLAKRLQPTRAHSGALRNFETNTIPIDGRRVPYMTLLNQAITEGTGVDPRLHVAELPNLAVSYLTSYLRRKGYGVEYINFFNFERERLARLLTDEPGVVAITTTFYVENGPVSELVRFVRERSPKTKIVVGGPHIYNICSHHDTLTQTMLLREIGADVYVYDSQGEATLARLLGALRPGGDGIASVPNLLYTTDGKKFQRTPRENEDNNLDENVIDWRSFDPGFYAPTAQMRTARSCAFKCSFCRYPVMAGALNLTSIEVAEQEMRYLREHGVKNLVFIDDTFNVPLPRFKELCRMMIRNKFEFDWFSYFRCGNADDAAFDLMAEAGCRGVFLGIESGDNGVLKNMNKFAKIERYAHGIKKLNERNIVSFASLIVGFPGETEQTIQNTIDFIESSAPTYYRAELYYHDTGAPIQERAAEFGIKSAGYSWRHSTMDWRAGTAAIDRMYRTIKSSTILPLYMFDFWSLPYLVGKGISLQKAKTFTETAQRMLLRSLDDEGADLSSERRALSAMFAPGSAAAPAG